VLVTAFADLDVGASIYARNEWRAIRLASDLLQIAVEHGGAPARYAYNLRSIEQVRRTGRPVFGSQGGFRDAFVPIGSGRPTALLVVGPFAIEYPDAATVLERWHELSKSHGRLSDPEFARYLDATLSMLTLEGPLFGLFERLMSSFAQLATAQGSIEPLLDEAEGLRVKLLEARFVERAWEAARSMVDERMTTIWETLIQKDPLTRVALQSAPKHAIVGLALAREGERDPVDTVIRRRAFQRAAVAFARRTGYAVSGRVGDHGITFLVAHAGGTARVRAVLLELVGRATALARRFGFELHSGISQEQLGESLAVRYRAALAAAERAATSGRRWLFSEESPKAPRMTELRRALGRSHAGNPRLIVPRFDHYIDATLAHSGYQLEGVRAHLAAGLERLVEPLLESGILDGRSMEQVTGSMNQETVTGLVASYRRAVAEIARAIEHPTHARQDKSLGRALDFIRSHLSEELSLARMSRIAGFAPSYFAKLFKQEERMTLGRYVQRQRIEHAKLMLSDSKLSIETIAYRAGFKSRTHFQRAFRLATGFTPARFRGRGTPAA
jgi:AraC-like DNA-binding protein